jgi:hypothetical protein
MIDILIPYVHSQNKFSELRYALRSIEQNLEGDRRIIIIGDVPDWIHRVVTIPQKRVSIGNGSNLNDMISKMDTVVHHNRVPGRFLRWYDDQYLLRKASPDAFDQHWGLEKFFFLRRPPEAKVYRRQLYETMLELRRSHLPEWNCEVHMPRILEKEKLRKILYNHIIFCGQRKLLQWQSLYFNTCKNEQDLVMIRKDDDVKAGFYGMDSENSFHSDSLEQIRKICSGKLILNHNDTGFTPAMEQYLKSLFPDKSRYEK